MRGAAPDVTTVSEAAWAEARRRAEILRPLAENAGRSKADVKAAAVRLGCRVVRAYALLSRYLTDPTVTGLLPMRRGRKRNASRLPAEMDALVDRAIESVYLTRARPKVADLVEAVRRQCRVLQVRAPGRKAIAARVRRKLPSTIVARREGGRAAHERFAPILGSLESPGPLALVQIDHTLVDVVVVDSVTRMAIQRPWLTVAIDVYSRCVVGFYLSLEAPSATSVALCIAQAALPKEAWLAQRGIEAVWPISGIMSTIHLDNAKEFRSEALRRGCEQYGIAIDYRPVRTPRYGGHIERLIGTLMGKVHLLAGTTYSGIDAKGDLNPDDNAAMTLEEVERWLGHAIAGVYHGTFHRGISTTPRAARTFPKTASTSSSRRRRRG